MTYCSIDRHTRSQKEAVQCGRLNRHARELYLAHTLAYHIRPTADGSSASSLRLRLVLETSFARHEPTPMLPYGRPGRVAKLLTMLAVRAQCRGTDYSRLAHPVIDFLYYLITTLPGSYACTC